MAKKDLTVYTNDQPLTYENRFPKNVVGLLHPKSNFSPQQALASAATIPFNAVLIIGYDVNGELMIRSSSMARNDSLWLLHDAIDYVRGNRT